MAVLECPLCCAESFSDICSLENHLLDLCENIICPICELQFRTIRTLAWHLGQECSHALQADKLNIEVLNSTENEEMTKIGNISAGKVEENLVLREVVKNNVTDIESKGLQEYITAKDPSCNGAHKIDNHIEIESKIVYEDRIEDHVVHSTSLYSCSVCNTTFSSIEEHLNEFHQDENVFIDYNVNESCNEINNVKGKRNVALEEKLSNSEYLSKESNSLIWTQDEINSLMVMDLESKAECLNKSDLNETENPVFACAQNSDKRQWVLTARGYYISSAETAKETRNKINTLMKKDRSTLNIIGCCFDEEWEESLKKHPLATFVVYNELAAEENMLYSNENKQYLFKDHRVRLLKINRKGPPQIEDIPFPEEPPDCVLPVFEQSHNVPEDLVGSYAVMWPCHLCGASTYHWSDLAKHCCSSSSKYHPCTLCKKSFQTRRSLNNHYSVIHKIMRSLNDCFPCPLCPAKVQTSSHLAKHLGMHKKNDLIKCNFCQSMVQKSIFSDHLKAHEKNGPLNFVCQLCNRPFKGESELQLHIPQCHLKSFDEDNLKCHICKSNYEDLETLREHMVSHGIQIKPHPCLFCPKSYNRLIDKVIHEWVHTKSKPHSCKECGRCFRLRHSLIAHMRIHTGERPFKCSSCTRTFRTKHLLRSHLAIHYQFKCRYCNKQFHSKDKVEVHENSHKKPFVCIDCKRVFYSLGFAKKHMENHNNGQLRFTCNMCPNMFTRAAYLESHLRTKHGFDTLTSISVSTQKTYELMEDSLKK